MSIFSTEVTNTDLVNQHVSLVLPKEIIQTEAEMPGVFVHDLLQHLVLVSAILDSNASLELKNHAHYFVQGDRSEMINVGIFAALGAFYNGAVECTIEESIVKMIKIFLKTGPTESKDTELSKVGFTSEIDEYVSAKVGREVLLTREFIDHLDAIAASCITRFENLKNHIKTTIPGCEFIKDKNLGEFMTLMVGDLNNSAVSERFSSAVKDYFMKDNYQNLVEAGVLSANILPQSFLGEA